jgi:hypothetical protein
MSMAKYRSKVEKSTTKKTRKTIKEEKISSKKMGKEHQQFKGKKGW